MRVAENGAPLSLREYDALLAVSLRARGLDATDPNIAELLRRGLAAAHNGSVVTTPAGETYLRETTKRAIRESAAWLKPSSGLGST